MVEEFYRIPVPIEEEEEVLLLNHPAVLAVLSESERIANIIARRLLEFRKLLEDSRDLVELFSKARPIPDASPRLGGVAIDSTYPPDGGVELVGGHLAGVVAGYIVFGVPCERECRAAYAKAFFIDAEDPKRKLQLFSKLLEKYVARKVLGLIKDHVLDGVKLLLFDGEIVPYILLFTSAERIEASKLLRRLDEAATGLLEEAKRLGITLVGVIKRSYSKILSALMGTMLPLNDKAIASLILKRGHYIELGELEKLLPLYARLEHSSKGFDKIVSTRLRARPDYGRIKVFFYKPSTSTAYDQAVKIELLDYGGLGAENVIALLNTLTNPATGIPYPVDLIDEYVRLESHTLELLRRKVASMLASLGGDTLTVLGHTNPEKRYLVE
ncbi:MAG: DNA double-strand break repair nuclease NurA [Pyrodictiaceae archaeon]